MSPSTLLGIIAIFYSLLYVLDTLLKSSYTLPYLTTLRNLGLDLRLFQVKWTTEKFNRFLTRCGRCRPRLLQAWFTAGSVTASLLLLPSLLFLCHSLLSYSATASHDRVVLQPVLPGDSKAYNNQPLLY